MKDIVNRIFAGLRLVSWVISIFVIPAILIICIVIYTLLGSWRLFIHFISDNDTTFEWFAFYDGTDYIPALIVILWLCYLLFVAYLLGGNSSGNENTHENRE